MEAVTPGDMVEIIDYATKALYAVLFCLGYVAGSPR